MRVVFDDGRDVPVRKLTLEDWRRFMAEFMRGNAYAAAAWDIMGCVRGPDAGIGVQSERPDMESDEHNTAYEARRKRKRQTVEVIRYAMFYGVVGGAARHHEGTTVTVPPKSRHDHFDRHVVRAAKALGLTVKESK